MKLGNSAREYGAISLSLHWLTAGLVVLAWLLGTFGNDLPKGGARAAGLYVHISAGVGIILLVALRVGSRLVDPPPPFEPTRFGHWLDIAAKASHLALYVLLIAIPITGVLLQFARGGPLPLFGLFDIASPWTKDRTLAGSLQEIHETLANLLMIAAGLHAAAALVHHYVLHDRTLARMLPGLAR